MALWVILSLVCYFRPGEAMSLLTTSLIAPCPLAGQAFTAWGILLHDADFGVAGKTGLMDEAVLLDLDAWLGPLLWALSRTRPPGGSLWDIDIEQLRVAFIEAVFALGLSVVAQTCTPYATAARRTTCCGSVGLLRRCSAAGAGARPRACVATRKRRDS